MQSGYRNWLSKVTAVSGQKQSATLSGFHSLNGLGSI